MKIEGFTYNGIHSSEFSCWYIPSEADKMLTTPDFEIIDTDVTGRDGGYYYGNRVKSREISLQCFFEDITLETKERLYQWLDRNTSGKLIFDNRPFVYYEVRPSKRITGKIYTNRYANNNEDTYSGTQTIVFKAHDPFGYMMYDQYYSIDTDGAGRYCGILESQFMPPKPKTTDKTFMMYNCGIYPCDTVIRIGGTAPNGLKIINRTSGTVCSLVSLPALGYLEISSKHGSVEEVYGTIRDIKFEYHNDGFIQLVPCGFLKDNVIVTYTKSSNKISISNMDVTNEQVGKHVYLAGKWSRIIAVLNDGSVVLSQNMTKGGSEITKIAQQNEIDIEGTNVSLNKLEMDYIPRVN